MRLEAIRAALGVDKKCRVETKLQAWDVFLLTRLVGNLKGSQVDFITICILINKVWVVNGEGV